MWNEATKLWPMDKVDTAPSVCKSHFIEMRPYYLSVGLEPIACKAAQCTHVGGDGNIPYLDKGRMSWVRTSCTTCQTIHL